MKPIVAIVGRPNVGKSTLFNRLIGRHKAVVANEPGVTRDLNYAEVEERGRVFTLVDTGGFEVGPVDSIQAQVRDQARLAIEDADIIMLLMDAKGGLMPDDIDLVGMLRKVAKPVLYVVNKVDSARLEELMADFYAIGVDELHAVSAEAGRNLGDLMDAVIDSLPPETPEVDDDPERVKVAIMGRPNVGKSSILNRLIGKKRALVSSIAGTTRDPVDTPFERDGARYLFIDTAGIRKKTRVSLTVEAYCVMEAIKSIERCDIAILVIDASEGPSMQDEKIAGLIESRSRCCVIVVNKWDLVEKETQTMIHATESIKEKLPFIAFAPVVFVSALTGSRLPKIFEAVDTVVRDGAVSIPTARLNSVLKDAVVRHPPAQYKGRAVKFFYVTQSGVSPPRFVIFTNYVEGVKDAYRRYLVNYMRDALGMENVPVLLTLRSRR
jgi:GTP-binding protein